MTTKDVIQFVIDNIPRTKWSNWLITNHPEINKWIIDNTKQYNPIDIIEAIYLIINQAPKLCELGNKPSFGSFKHGYNKFCKPHCHCSKKYMSDIKLNRSDEEKLNTLKKSVNTNLERYGVENPNQSAILREKAKQTNLERYGYMSASQSDIIKNKIKQTNLERYGVENPNQSAILREKAKQTNLERYGYSSASQSPIFKEKSKQTNLEFYGFDHQSQSDIIKNKIKQTNLERYGVECSQQSPDIKEKTTITMIDKYGVPVVSAIHLTSEQYAKLHSIEWFAIVLETMSMSEIAQELNINISTVYRKTREFNLRPYKGHCRSQAENELGDYIRSLGFTDIIINDREIIKPKELDIVIPSAKLAIEFCGIYWHSEDYKEQYYHKNKLDIANKAGYQLLTIFDDEWIKSPNVVRAAIAHKLGKSHEKIFARNTTIHEIFDNSVIKDFYEINHIQGWDKGSTITYSLTYNNKYIAMMSFEKYQENKMYLTRYATNIHVIGGASKLLYNFFKNNPSINQIISFADLRWSNGDLYEKLGFKLDKILTPDYQYIVNGKRVHKFNFRKASLKKLFGHQLDTDNMTEKEVMLAMNIPRIWDCGKLRYIIFRPNT